MYPYAYLALMYLDFLNDIVCSIDNGSKALKAPFAKITCQVKLKSWGAAPTPANIIPVIMPKYRHALEQIMDCLESSLKMNNL